MKKAKPKQKLEEDGLEFITPEHWETWNSKIYVYKDVRSNSRNSVLLVPATIVRHLNLHHKQKVKIAIKPLP